MNENGKKWINRGGLLAVILGMIAIQVSGGDASAALELAGKISTVSGIALVALRELFN